MKTTFYIALLLITISSFFFLNSSSFSQDKKKPVPAKNTEENFIENLLSKYPKEFKNILDNPRKYEVQIIYTQINRDKNNVPSFKQFSYHLNPANYFYPASMVKLPCSALALEKINRLHVPGLDRNTWMQTDSSYICQRRVTRDSTASNYVPSVGQYIKRMLLVSDNDAYSRIYELLGQQYIKDELTRKGYPNIHIIHRFDMNCNHEQNKCTNHISFFDAAGKIVYEQPMAMCSTELKNPLGTVKKGVGYIDVNGKYCKGPKDCTNMNYMSLQDITSILKSIIFPNSVEKEKRFDLTKDDYTFLYKYLSMLPRESDYPHYDMKSYEDSYKKYFMYGTYHKKIEVDSVRIFNIVGQSYGNLADVAYIVNTDKHIEFMLSAVIYVNANGILNSGAYEYKAIGFPFMNDLGNTIYNYESKRKKDNLPDLSAFKLR